MTYEDLLEFITQALYFGLFVIVAIHAVRRPYRAFIDIALLFGALALIVTEQWAEQLFGFQPSRPFQILRTVLILAVPYLQVRLVDDFAVLPRWIPRLAAGGLAVVAAANVLGPDPLPVPVLLLLVLYFVGFQTFAALAFARQARHTRGVTSRRMQAVAIGASLLGLLVLLAGTQVAAPQLEEPLRVASLLASLLSGVAFFIGFAPPSILRRAWQEPEIRAFLGRAAQLPRLHTTAALARELERDAALWFGAPRASVWLWNDEHGTLTLSRPGEEWATAPANHILGRAFTQQRALFTPNVAKDDPEHTELYERYGICAALAAPITAGQKRLGVLAVYAQRAPIFADDDLELVRLLADQAAVILESRSLIEAAARVQAREHATQLKDDFLSAAAHDLKTPLTTLIAQAQLMERRALRTPEAPADLASIQRIVREAKRLNSLVLELLDVSRLEQGRLITILEPVDLREIALEVCDRGDLERHRCVIDAPEPVVGDFDRNRVSQLLANLVENGVKYSPEGGEICIRIRKLGAEAELTVSDQGIGIAPEDLGEIFDRFQRGRNVDDRRFAGMGLGLYICRGIAEQHGGRIWATSEGIGKGSTFHVRLPLSAEIDLPSSTEVAAGA